MNIPQIGISLGDPGGIGPEIVIKALAQQSSLPKAHFILFGSSRLLEEEKRALGIELDYQAFGEKGSADRFWISLHEIKTSLDSIKKGEPSSQNGRASFLFFEGAVKEARRGRVHAIVTAPVSKRSWGLAGIKWRGHTDYLEHLYPQAIMSFWSEDMRVALLSHHLPLKKALKKIKREYLRQFFRRLQQSLENFSQGKYQILVSGLNPHAGEEGLLGEEEKKEIVPAIEEARQEGMNISGPFPPDIVFRYALGRPENIVVSLYHDQGLIAFKLKSFDTGVNVTLGLPFIRTSPDHGTAFDIAGKGEANPQSMKEAITLAYKLSSKSL
ncbi:MAG: 4-hydroxythreonine-4-phosphate dehydrogenase PdxA [Candidatus Aminicenantales bacterium]